MAQTQQSYLSIRINEVDKKEFEKFCNDVGMNVSVAVNMFIKAVLQDNKIPFEIVRKPQYSEELKEALAEAKEMREHPEKYKKFNTVKDLMEDLDND